jgi:4-amino-4-deoxy-L-arabinose transferase-like glycosyltransferase
MADANPSDRSGRTDPVLAHRIGFACLLAAVWMIPGLLGHDPWKPDEAQNFGIVYEMLQTGDWVVPTLAGEPYLRNPPLIHVTAALFGTLLEPVLPLHEGARLASGFYLALTLLLVAATTRELMGAGKGWLALLALLGSIGLLVPGHLLVPDIPHLAGFALALYGLALALRRPALGGLALGTGLGIAFLSKGFVGPLALAIAIALLPASSATWRTRRYALAVAIAVAAALPWLLIWPALLFQHSPALFDAWVWTESVGRFSGNDGIWPPGTPGFYLAILPWFAFPALPLAAWGVWTERRSLREPRLLLPLVVAAALLGLLSIGGTPREVQALPALAPLAVLAVVGLLHLRRSASNAFWWFSMLFASLMVLMAWFEWMALEVGFPERRNRHWLRLQPGYVSDIDPFVLVAAIALTAVWVWLLLRLRRSPERPLIAWTAGVAVVWALGFTMFGDYADAGKSYRHMVMSIARELPPEHGCISSYNLGEPQRAMLHYFAGIRTYRESVPGRERDCELLLVQGARANIYVPGPEWMQIWEGARRGDRRELYRLYRRG